MMRPGFSLLKSWNPASIHNEAQAVRDAAALLATASSTIEDSAYETRTSWRGPGADIAFGGIGNYQQSLHTTERDFLQIANTLDDGADALEPPRANALDLETRALGEGFDVSDEGLVTVSATQQAEAAAENVLTPGAAAIALTLLEERAAELSSLIDIELSAIDSADQSMAQALLTGGTPSGSSLLATGGSSTPLDPTQQPPGPNMLAGSITGSLLVQLISDGAAPYVKTDKTAAILTHNFDVITPSSGGLVRRVPASAIKQVPGIGNVFTITMAGAATKNDIEAGVEPEAAVLANGAGALTTVTIAATGAAVGAEIAAAAALGSFGGPFGVGIAVGSVFLAEWVGSRVSEATKNEVGGSK